MTHWGPGAIPPGYILAPDGTLVPVHPSAPPAPYPSPYGPPVPAAIPPGAVPYGYAQPAAPLPSTAAPATVTVTVTTGAPVYPTAPAPMMTPMPPVPAPSMSGAAAPLAHGALPYATPPAALPAGMPPGAPPTPYAPGWSQPHSTPPGAMSNGESSLVLAREQDGLASRERYTGDPGSVGALSLATSGLILATALATVTFFVVPVGAVLASAAVASGVTGGMGLWLLRQRKRARGKVDLDPELQVRLLDLASQKRGRLTVTSTAQGLGLTLDEAEKALQAMARSHYVDVELDPDVGVVTYVFRELAPPPAQLPSNTSEAPTR